MESEILISEEEDMQSEMVMDDGETRMISEMEDGETIIVTLVEDDGEISPVEMVLFILINFFFKSIF